MPGLQVRKMSDKTPEQDSKRSEALIEPDQILGSRPTITTLARSWSGKLYPFQFGQTDIGTTTRLNTALGVRDLKLRLND